MAEGRERARLVRGLFAGIARRYELVNAIGSLGMDAWWRRRLVRTLGLERGEWLLDACCGTGDVGRDAARRGARVVGVDFCRPMLVRGAHGGARRHDLRFIEGDALSLPVRSSSMDAACVAFGLRNVADPDAGLRELVRCVRPGGTVAVLEFGRPPWRPARWACELYSARVLPVLGDLLSGRRGTYAYLPETIRTWMEPEELASRMTRAGLSGVRWTRMSLGIATLHSGRVSATGERPGAESEQC